MEGPRKQKICVNLFKVDFPDDPPKKVFLPSKISQLLKIATDALDLPREAQQIFDVNGKRVTTLEGIEPKTKLFISCTKPIPEVEDEPLYKTRNPICATKEKYVSVKQPPVKEVRADAKNHQIIAASQKSVKDNVRDALLSLYNSLTPEHRAQLNCNEVLKKLTDDTQQYLLEHFILSQFIGPTSDVIGTDIGRETWNWCMDRLKGLKPEDVKILITGPARSGKSTIVNFLSSIVIQKLIISGDISNYLVCAINWFKYQSYAGDVCKLYDIFLEATLQGLNAAKMQYMPIMSLIKQWMTSARINQSLQTMPAALQNFPGFPVKDLTSVALRINAAYNNKSSLKAFITECVNLPANLANVFGFKNVIAIYDHFDLSGYIIQPYGRFANSKENVLLSAEICHAIEKTPFIVASLNDPDLSKVFSIKKHKNYTTERIVQNKDVPSINVVEPVISLTYDLCRGCPAYCAMYMKVVELAEAETSNRVIKQSFSKIHSVVDSTRRILVKQELGRLFSLLVEDNDGMSASFDDGITAPAFDISDVNKLMSKDEIVVKLQ